MVGSDHTKVVLRRFAILFGFAAALWAVQTVNWLTGYTLNVSFGLIPRQLSGLDGIIGMPALHGGFGHLMANTPPLLLMGTLLAVTTTRALIAINAVIVVLGGALVWLLGNSAIHVGASGLIFGWFGFLVARGLVDRSPVALGAAVLVVAFYGSIIWGLVPGQTGVAWEAHLFGALAGIVAACTIRTHVHHPRMRDVDRI